MDVTRREILFIPMAAVASELSGRSPLALPPSAATPPVRQVDHIMIRTHNPDRLFAFFTDVLQLPVAWPLLTRGRVRSGGAGFGNVNVEAIQFPEQSGSPSQDQLVGFGFEPQPSLEQCLAELDRRGIRYGDPRPFVARQPDGSEKTLFTNVTLRSFSDTDRPANAGIHVFLSEYSPAYVDVHQRRARLRNELSQRSGGPLGIRAVREIVVGSADLRTALGQWDAFLKPIRPTSAGVWRVGDGPAIRLVPAQDNRVMRLVIAVASLQQAQNALQARNLLGSNSKMGLTIDPSKIGGLNFLLIES